jgi:HEAT repeat protein
VSEQEVARLVQDLSHADWVARTRAARELGSIASGGKQAVCALVAALQDGNPRVRETATRALGKIGALGRIGSRRKQVISALAAALLDKSRCVRRAALGALADIVR